MQQHAADLNCVFFLDSGEGRDVSFADMEGEDLCGWLIPHEHANAFQGEWNNAQPSNRWLSFFCFAIWRIENGTMLIDFKDFS